MDTAMKDLKAAPAADEMFPEGAGTGFMDMDEQSGSSPGIMMDLASNEKHVHVGFYNDFGDLFDDDDVPSKLIRTALQQNK